jgi:hypothetical protein
VVEGAIQDSVADRVAPARHVVAGRSSTARTSSCLRGVPGMIEWIKTVQGITAMVGVIFATVVAW